MIDISEDLLVNKPTVTIISNTFVSIENYISIITYESNLIKIKTKEKIIKICGSDLSLKYIQEDEIGVKGIIYTLEYIN